MVTESTACRMLNSWIRTVKFRPRAWVTHDVRVTGPERSTGSEASLKVGSWG